MAPLRALPTWTAPVLALALSACNEGRSRPIAPDHASEARLSRFADCDDLRAYLVASWTESMLESSYGWGWGNDVALEAGGDDGAEGGDSGPTDYSETNTQEAGVDEPDLVKTDGDYLYVVQGDELHIVDSWPADEASLVSTLPLPGYATSLFLRGDRILVFGSDWEEGREGGAYTYTDLTRLTVIDASDRAAPEIVREVEVEGWLAGARMIDGQVYAVTNTWSWLPDALWNALWEIQEDLPQPDWDDEASVFRARALARVKVHGLASAYVQGLSDADLVPFVRDGLPGEDPDDAPLMACSDVYRPQTLSEPSQASVLHLDLNQDDAELSATGVLAVGWNLYASATHLTLAQTSWDWWWGDGDVDVETHLHRFALDGDGAIYEGSGAVRGWLLNQFSMSEHDGYLRVATTDVTGWGWETDQVAEPANHVFVLEPDGQSLDVVGHIGGIAPGETIQSARFLGEKGFLVTFEQVDPLFTLDLSEPTAPAVVGELKLPGFSTYLHPFDDDTLVAVGFAGTWEGEITGMAITMFDVSDFANPAIADELLLEGDDWSWSEALYDHHAFTLHNGVLSLPLYSWTWEDGHEEAFSGLLVVDVDADAGLTELGRVDHADLVSQSQCPWYDNGGRPCEDEYWYASMRRSVVIEDSLFSLSDYGVKVTGHRDPSVERATVVYHPLAD